MDMDNQISLPLEKIRHWEKERADQLYMTQPMGHGVLETFTWFRSVDEARRMASYLQSLDLAPKSRIGILSKNCAYWILSDWAIWMAGHVSVPIYPTLNAESVAYIIGHSGLEALFVGKLDDWPSMQAGVPESMRCITYPLSPRTDYPSWNDLISQQPAMTGEARRDGGDLATILYTSGSTGRPKGVMVSFQNMAFAAAGCSGALAMTVDDRMLSYLPLAHAFERLFVETCSLHCGFQLFFAESLETFLEDLQTARPTLFLGVPRIWTKFQAGVFAKLPAQRLARLLKIPLLNRLIKKKVLSKLGLQHVRIAGSGSAPLSGGMMDWYRGLGLELLEGYAMSENFGYSHLTKAGRLKTGYVGETLPGVQARIGHAGEVEVSSLATMSGYYQDPVATAAAFTEDGFLKTGDVGEIDSSGRLKLTGRLKDIFKTSKGKYIAPAPIESQLSRHPHIDLACVAGANYPSPHCLVVLTDEAQRQYANSDFRAELEAEFQQLMDDVNAGLDPHERLQFMAVMKDEWTIENSFLTPTLKLKRNRVEEAYRPMASGWYDRQQPVIWQ